MANPVPEKLINFRVYLEGSDMVGLADVTLPNLEAMTETVSGAGVAGEVDSPTLGHFASMTAGVTWRTVTKGAAKLAQQKAHTIDFRGAQQIYDAASGEYRSAPLKVVIKGVPKTTTLGTLNVGQATGTQNEFEVVYLKLWLDGEELVEIDKYNYIARFSGVDALAEVRRNLGM